MGAFSPLCGPCDAAAKQELFSGTVTSSIGKSHKASGGQVALRWLVENGSPVIPKTNNVTHLHQDLDLWGDNWGQGLTENERQMLNGATAPARGGANDCTYFGDSTIHV